MKEKKVVQTKEKMLQLQKEELMQKSGDKAKHIELKMIVAKVWLL